MTRLVGDPDSPRVFQLHNGPFHGVLLPPAAFGEIWPHEIIIGTAYGNVSFYQMRIGSLEDYDFSVSTPDGPYVGTLSSSKKMPT